MKERENTAELKPRASERFVGFAVHKRKLFFVIAVLIAVGCVLTSVWTPASRALWSFMPDSTNAGRGAVILDEEFTDPGEAKILLENVSISQCQLMRDRLSEMEGVYKAEFDENYYDHGRGVLNVTFYEPDDMKAFYEVKDVVDQFDGGIASDMGSGWGFGWGADLSMIILYAAAAALLIIALVYASRTYRDVFVSFLITAFAILINYGTIFILKRVSPVTMISAGVIQAVLTMYYAMMICRRYTVQRKNSGPEEAVITAVTGGMKRILAAAVIALAVFGGLMFAGIKLGLEFAIVMLKGVALSILCVYVFLPGLLMANAKKMDKSRHQPLLPKVKKRGRFTFNTKTVFPILFAVLAIGAIVFNYVYQVDPLAYSDGRMPLPVKTGSQWIETRIESIFGKESGTMDMIVPAGDPAAEEELTKALSALPEVVSVKSVANAAAAGYDLGDRISTWQLADITGIDKSNAEALFEGYITEQSGGIPITMEREIPFAGILEYTYDRMKDGSLEVPEAVAERVSEVYKDLRVEADRLMGETHDRLIIGVRLPYDSTEAAKAADNIRTVGQGFFEDEVYLTGDLGIVSDAAARYKLDVIIVMAVTTVFLICALFLLLRKIGQAIVLAFMVQGGAWLSMAVPYILPGYMLFAGAMLGYAVQTCALATYAASTANSYNKNKKDNTLKWAIGKAMKDNYVPVTVTCVFLILSGALLAVLSFNKSVMSLGIAIAVGGIIDIIVALAVIPQTLLFWDIIAAKVTGQPIVLSSAPPVPANDGRMDIVDAIEKLKSDEYKAMMESPEETIELPSQRQDASEAPAGAEELNEELPGDPEILPETGSAETPEPEIELPGYPESLTEDGAPAADDPFADLFGETPEPFENGEKEDVQ